MIKLWNLNFPNTSTKTCEAAAVRAHGAPEEQACACFSASFRATLFQKGIGCNVNLKLKCLLEGPLRLRQRGGFHRNTGTEKGQELRTQQPHTGVPTPERVAKRRPTGSSARGGPGPQARPTLLLTEPRPSSFQTHVGLREILEDEHRRWRPPLKEDPERE